MFRCLSTIFLMTILSGSLQNMLAQAKPLQGKKVITVIPEKYPFIVSIARSPNPSHPGKRYYCTGVLVSPEFVLTAAHCFSTKWAKNNRTGNSNNPQESNTHDTSMWITYDHWAESKNITKMNGTNDIALLKLSRPVNNPGVRPARMALEKPTDLIGKNVKLVGWHKPKNDTNSSKKINVGVVKVLRKQTCEHITKLFFNQTIVYPEKYLCTRGYPLVYPSSGDSGAPVISDGHVVAINRGKCPKLSSCDLHHSVLNTDKFNVHTTLYPYSDFILDVIQHY